MHYENMRECVAYRLWTGASWMVPVLVLVFGAALVLLTFFLIDKKQKHRNVLVGLVVAVVALSLLALCLYCSFIVNWDCPAF